MASALSNGVRRVAARLSPDPTPDGELLSRFLTSRDEPAFAELVRRHGRMVFAACRRVLGNAADADDAFQAAFVVLVRKAHSLTGRACVGNFLYATAVLTARKARTMATRRRANEAKATRPESAGPTGAGDEVPRVLDEELAGLPAKYHKPVVLCDLEGVSRREAAARLGVPEGTVSSRLATAHRMLAKRLAARGFAAVAVAAVLGKRASAVPAALADAAVRAAVGGPPAGVTPLVSEVTKMLLWNKLRSGAAVLAGVALLLGVGVGLVQKGGAADDKPGLKAPVPEKKAEPKDEDLIQGSWQAVAAESDGKKAPDEAVKAVVLRFQGTEATFTGAKVLTFELDPKAKPKGLTLTPADGPQKGVKVESAIYELTGDDLKVCVDWGRDGKAGTRPTDFTTAPRDGRISLTLKRVKEGKRDEPKKEEAKKPDEAKKAIPGTLLLACNSGLLTLTPEGTETGEIETQKGAHSDLQSRLSPDGTRAASVVNTSEPRTGGGNANDPWQYRVVINKIGTTEPLAAADFPTHRRPHLCWAPDGKKVVVSTAPKEYGSLRHDLVDAETGKIEAIELPANVLVRDWSPDGKTVLALLHENKKYHLVLATRGEKSAKKLTELKSTYGADLARFSPDGKKILFTDGDPEQKDAFRWNRSSLPYIFDLATQQRQPLAEFPKNATCVGLAWSPDGKRVAYTWTQLHEDLLKKDILQAEDLLGRETESCLVIADADGKNVKTVKTVKSENAVARFLGTVDWR